jgi:hypothetical protein
MRICNERAIPVIIRRKTEIMIIKRLIQRASITGVAVFILAAGASAGNITYMTNTANTGFNNTTANTMDETSGQAATLTFTPNSSSMSGTPSNIDLGDFLITCPTCSLSTAATLLPANFTGFTFNLIVTDVTDGGTSGEFVGSSSGGTIFSDTSNIDITWSPLQIGPGTSNALPGIGTGNFGVTFFTIASPTEIVAPNSGSPEGDSTVQGFVQSVTPSTPEPATFVMIGGGLVGLGILRRRKLFRS